MAMSQELSNLLDLVENIKIKITDQEYMDLMNAMMALHNAPRLNEGVNVAHYDHVRQVIGNLNLLLNPQVQARQIQAPQVQAPPVQAPQRPRPARNFSNRFYIWNSRTNRHIYNDHRNRTRLLNDNIITQTQFTRASNLRNGQAILLSSYP